MSIINKHGANCLKMETEKALQLLGLIRRASQLVTGENMVLKAIRNQSVTLVLLANDAGPTSAKKIRDKANFYNIAIISAFTKAELSNATGLERTVLAVKNPGFSKKLLELTKTEGA